VFGRSAFIVRGQMPTTIWAPVLDVLEFRQAKHQQAAEPQTLEEKPRINIAFKINPPLFSPHEQKEQHQHPGEQAERRVDAGAARETARRTRERHRVGRAVLVAALVRDDYRRWRGRDGRKLWWGMWRVWKRTLS